MEPECSLHYLQQPATCSCPKPDQSIPCLPTHLLKLRFNIILPSTLEPSKWSLFLRSPVFHICHMVRPYHSPSVDHPKNIWLGIQVMRLLIQSSPVPCHLVPPRPKYLPQHPILKYPQPVFLCQCETTAKLQCFIE